VRLVVARADVHDGGEVASFEQPDAAVSALARP
jgi:hypothetical protein